MVTDEKRWIISGSPDRKGIFFDEKGWYWWERDDSFPPHPDRKGICMRWKGMNHFPFLQIEKELYPMKRDGTQWKGMVPDEKGMTHFPLLRIEMEFVSDENRWYPMKRGGSQWKGMNHFPPPSLRIFRSQGSPRVGDLFKASHYWPESYQCIESMPRGAALLEKVSLLFSTIYSA